MEEIMVVKYSYTFGCQLFHLALSNSGSDPWCRYSSVYHQFVRKLTNLCCSFHVFAMLGYNITTQSLQRSCCSVGMNDTTLQPYPQIPKTFRHTSGHDQSIFQLTFPIWCYQHLSCIYHSIHR